MREQVQDPAMNFFAEFSTRLADIEERQRLLKDRVLLIGENLISTKEESEKELFELKMQLKNFNQDIATIKHLLSRVTEVMSEFARKSELEILQRQFKMFEPFKK